MKIPKWLKKIRIGVLWGGISEEREISKKTGRAILLALEGLGLSVVGIDVDRSLPQKILSQKIGFCFIALHGRLGEDGTVQGLCEVLGVPYSGSGVLASALSMNKAISKRLFQGSGIPTPPFQLFDSTSIDPLIKNGKKIGKVPIPFVVKPVDSGSAIGITIVKKKSDLREAIRTAFRYSRQIMMEKFIKGREITASILGKTVLPLIEIIPKNSFYDYSAKYERGMSEHILPAKISRKAEKSLRQYAFAAHTILECKAFSRVDFILDSQDQPWILELNSIPGMTETSLFPEAARAAGFSFPEMVLEIIQRSGLNSSYVSQKIGQGFL